MENLKEAILMERRRLFVGRQAEIAYVDEWLSAAHAATEVVFVSGMGGIGKSALLLKFLDMAQRAKALCLWLDSRICNDSPAGFLEAIHSLIKQTAGTAAPFQAPMTDILETVAGHRTVLCIDNYDSLHLIEGWLREMFLPELPAREVLVVLAGRQQLSSEWQNDLAWRGRLRMMPLEPLSYADVRTYYGNLGLDDSDAIETLIQDTHGHPLAMALAADTVHREEREIKSASWPVSRLVSAQLLREVVSPDFHEILDLLCILPHANQESLNRLLSSPLNVNQLHQLSRLSFIRPAMGGFALHDVAREHLLEDFRNRETARFQSLRRRIVDDACIALRAAKPHEKNGIAATLLSICRDALPQGFFYRKTAPSAFDQFREGDLPHLHRLLVEERPQLALSLESEAKAHELLDNLTQHFPESVRVFRSDQGIPVMFHAGLLLYRDTFTFLQTYIPRVPEACFPSEAQRMSRLRHEEADTYYHFLGGVAGSDAKYIPQQLFELMFTDGFSRIISRGIRFTLTTKSDELMTRLQMLGFQTRPLHLLPPGHPAHGGTVLELDLRTRDFGQWVTSFIHSAIANHPPVEQMNPDDIRAALAVLDDPAALGQTALARRLLLSGHETQRLFMRLLNADPPPPPLSARNQSILRLLRSHPSLSSDAAASRLFVSRATYYRHLSETIDRAIQALEQSRK
ncbi:AAA family ATPase [Paenibacillus allorhizosphaerae]|uniref:Orc1-like AAA ATPase domain-containing protein n=1 Tax=Paenibacillus allorhizosphaerae TaxID=2849866 RepID=A0ABN7TX45_9BACL|nr:ATP-binding protein [Paenibacillus allorhizosphaerae]CAG7655879.1 hypothetical protein PAECIP111802_06237 [Paenibacillus allorhizosphaerae]